MHVAIGPAFGSHYGHSPTAFGQTRRYAERYVVETVIAHADRGRTAALCVDGVGHDVDRTTDRRCRDFRCTQTALHLHAACHVGQTSPVRPVDFTAFHVVHRHAVDHDGDIFGRETAQTDLRVAVTAARFGRIGTRRRFQNLGELLRAEFVIDVGSRHGRHGNRRLALHGHRLRNDDILHGDGIRLHVDDAQLDVALTLELLDESLVSDERNFHGVSVGTRFQRESTVGVRVGAVARSRNDDRSSDERSVVFVDYLTGNYRLSDSRCGTEQHQCRHQTEKV